MLGLFRQLTFHYLTVFYLNRIFRNIWMQFRVSIFIETHKGDKKYMKDFFVFTFISLL